MKKSIFILAILASSLAGCSHTRVIQLNVPDDYAPPKSIPFTSDADRKEYLIGYREGWLHTATQAKTIVDVRKQTSVHHTACQCLYPAGSPKSKGFDAGDLRASQQFQELEKRSMSEYASQFGWKTREPNKMLEATSQ